MLVQLAILKKSFRKTNYVQLHTKQHVVKFTDYYFIYIQLRLINYISEQESPPAWTQEVYRPAGGPVILVEVVNNKEKMYKFVIIYFNIYLNQ